MKFRHRLEVLKFLELNSRFRQTSSATELMWRTKQTSKELKSVVIQKIIGKKLLKHISSALHLLGIAVDNGFCCLAGRRWLTHRINFEELAALSIISATSAGLET